LLIGFVLALLFAGGSQPARRAALGTGWTMAILFLCLLLPRLVQVIHPDVGSGPQFWWIQVLRPLPWGWLGYQVVPNALHPYDTAVLSHLAAAAVAGVAWPLVTLGLRLRPPGLHRPLPFATTLAVVLAAVAGFGPLVAHRAWWRSEVVPGMEFMAIAPVLAILLAIRLHAAWSPDARRPGAAAPTPRAPSLPDVRAAWIDAGVLDAGSEPRFRLPLEDHPTQPSLSVSGRAARAWASAGGFGLAPGALDDLLAAPRPAVWQVPDLPDSTAITLVAAFLADRVGVAGHRVLVVASDPEKFASSWTSALGRVHAWSPGAVTVGSVALKEAVARSRLPALVAMDMEDLARSVAPWVARDGARWAETLTWIVVVHPEEGGPRSTSYTAFAWRTWELATRGQSRASVLAITEDGPAIEGYLQVLFPGRPIERCTFRARTPGAVVIWPANASASTQADPWLDRARRAADQRGMPPQPFGSGGCSVATWDAADLVRAWRAAHHRLYDPGFPVHHALWNVVPSPLSAYLEAPGRLPALAERRELPAARPVIGLDNRFLRLAWLNAALHDALADEAALRAAFGDDLVDFARRDAESTGAWRARVEGDRVVRAPVLRGASGAKVPELRREALTTQVVELWDPVGGVRLGVVDRPVAATRYHPKRVFERLDRRWRVPLHAMDDARGRLTVEPADPREAITSPLLRVTLELRQLQVERVTRTQGPLEVSTCTIDAMVTEEVVGAWVPEREVVERFDPVRSQYDTVVRCIRLRDAEPGPALGHLAGLLGSLLPAHLRVDSEDVEVVAFGQGLVPDWPCGLAVVDRHLGGLGIARALDDGTVMDLVRWARAVTHACRCEQGCVRCTPGLVLRLGPDKPTLLRWLPKA
jgi:hypothetical protein